MTYKAESADMIIVGGGHAGCEAALAAARMGLKTILFAINLDSIAMMPCNPNIGGTSKGHLVREIDALGGEMGKNIDKTFIQTRMLNLAKGPAVHSLRAQADKAKYSQAMKWTLENTEGLLIKQAEVIELMTEDNKITGVLTESGSVYDAKAVVLCTGTYLKARCLYGETIIESGPNGLRNSTLLSECLKKLNVTMFRFKTGTPARVDSRTIDYSKMQIQEGDTKIIPFSFENDPEEIRRVQVPCYLTYTNEETHEIIRKNLHRSPMYAGVIEGTGTRYCPSIEDKIVRFSDKDRHQVFIEPEGENTREAYIQGMSSSLPLDVQIAMYRSIPGLENCEIMRNAYAIEYDCIDATQLKLTLEFKEISGLYSAGQFNGSSGYEEAAAQGLLAGMNAACKILGREPLIIDRSEGYIGVLIDDLVTKGSTEPYRMMTSRAEYRLLLRQDNADLRLTQKGFDCGLIKKDRYDRFIEKKQLVENEMKRIQNLNIVPSEKTNEVLKKAGCIEITTGYKLADLIKRPELSYDCLESLDEERPIFNEAIREQVNIQIKYEGYILKQQQKVEQFKKLENKVLSYEIDYTKIKGLSVEATQKLSKIRPANFGQASRITGVSPSDILVLHVYVENNKKN